MKPNRNLKEFVKKLELVREPGVVCVLKAEVREEILSKLKQSGFEIADNSFSAAESLAVGRSVVLQSEGSDARQFFLELVDRDGAVTVREPEATLKSYYLKPCGGILVVLLGELSPSFSESLTSRGSLVLEVG